MPKEDCKYWDKCYQRNEQHLQKYNHPAKPESNEAGSSAAEQPKRRPSKEASHNEATSAVDNEAAAATKSPKRRASKDTEVSSSSDTKADAAQQDERNEIDTTALREEVLGSMAGKNYLAMLEKRIKYSALTEYNELLQSNEFIRHKFLVEMPPDFYAFWKFINTLKKDSDGDKALRYIESQFQLQLVGPFEFLAGRFHKAAIREPGDYLRHWRFFYDPPEFQTVFVRRGTGIHYGYWRDVPQDKDELMLARNDMKKDCEFEFVAGNIFDAFLYYLEKDFQATPFTASAVASVKKSLHKFIEDNEVKYEKLEALRKKRTLKVVAKTFHRAGIVVPYDAKTQQGYRPLMVSENELKKILRLFEHGDNVLEREKFIRDVVIEKLTPIVTAASIALDECDFGTSLELGINLFCSGYVELHVMAQSLLVSAYTLLSRPQFIAISKAHMETRLKDVNLSMFQDEDKK